MPAIPSAILFINTDLTPAVKSVLVQQLFISEVISATEFNGRVADEPEYPEIIHQQGLRILVLWDFDGYTTNRCLADVIMFYKAGLISIERNNCGPSGHTIRADNVTVQKLLQHFPPPFKSSGRGGKDPCVQSNILWPLHCPERWPPLFPLGSDRSWRRRRDDCSVFDRYPDHRCCDKDECCGENHRSDCCFPEYCLPSYIPPEPCPPEPCPPHPHPPAPQFNATYLQGIPIALTKPTTDQVLEFNGSSWAPADNSGGSGFEAGQDLSGTATEQTVIGLYDHPIANTTPTQSSVPVWDGTIYDIRQLSLDDLAPGFSITSFGGGSTVEVGVTVINPSFTATYSTVPTSASITNTDAIDSPLVLMSPFTSGTVVGSFIHTSASSTTFSLTAIGTSTKTANTAINWEIRGFGGVGNSGASSATAVGNNALLTTGDTIDSLGLFGGVVGQSFGIFSPTAQNIYLILPHTVSQHTFKDQFGFVFPMNSPTVFSFTNQYGSVISMDLYQSTNSLSTPFTLTVTS